MLRFVSFARWLLLRVFIKNTIEQLPCVCVLVHYEVFQKHISCFILVSSQVAHVERVIIS